jgi:hypothetical protein
MVLIGDISIPSGKKSCIGREIMLVITLSMIQALAQNSHNTSTPCHALSPWASHPESMELEFTFPEKFLMVFKKASMSILTMPCL